MDLSPPIRRRTSPIIEYQRDLARLAPAPPAQFINWAPGHYVTVSNGSSFSGVATINSEIDFVIARDPADTVLGIEITFSFAQCEGAFGDYSAWFNNVQQVLTHCQAQSPPRTLGIAINITGNAGGGSVPGYMIDNSTYGPTGGTPGGDGAHGGQYVSAGTPIGRYDNANFCTRLAAACTALYNQFGTQIFSLNPLFSEVQDMQTIVPGMTVAAIQATVTGNSGLYAQIRAGMPRTYLKFSPSSLPQTSFPAFYAMSDAFKISCGVYDGANDSRVAGGANWIHTNSMAAFCGGSYGAGPAYTFIPGDPSLRDRRNTIGGQDWHSFSNNDETGNRSATIAMPPAHHGDGRLFIIWQTDVTMQTSHKWWLSQRSSGPPCNQIGTHAGQPANYPGVFWTDMIDFMRQNPFTQPYPFNW
jgi:hypothetical protein